MATVSFSTYYTFFNQNEPQTREKYISMCAQLCVLYKEQNSLAHE